MPVRSGATPHSGRGGLSRAAGVRPSAGVDELQWKSAAIGERDMSDRWRPARRCPAGALRLVPPALPGDDALVGRAREPARHRRYTQRGQRHAGTAANRAGESTGTISLPSGINDTGISLRLASASGMPTSVSAIATALTK